MTRRIALAVMVLVAALGLAGCLVPSDAERNKAYREMWAAETELKDFEREMKLKAEDRAHERRLELLKSEDRASETSLELEDRVYKAKVMCVRNGVDPDIVCIHCAGFRDKWGRCETCGK